MEDYMPSETGARFYDFIENELITYMIEKTTAALDFRVAIGHGETANFMNYFMFNSRPVFQRLCSPEPKLIV